MEDFFHASVKPPVEKNYPRRIFILLTFFAMVALCDLVVCGDTMAMHAALGLKKNVVAIFGPTSYNEIEMYGRGIKIVSMECNCCYKPDCNKKVKCMDKVSVENVLDAIQTYIY